MLKLYVHFANVGTMRLHVFNAPETNRLPKQQKTCRVAQAGAHMVSFLRLSSSFTLSEHLSIFGNQRSDFSECTSSCVGAR